MATISNKSQVSSTQLKDKELDKNIIIDHAIIDMHKSIAVHVEAINKLLADNNIKDVSEYMQPLILDNKLCRYCSIDYLYKHHSAINPK